MENITAEFLTLDEINKKAIRQLTAPMVYLFILMIVGIPGNLIVLIIYRQSYLKSVYKTIIWKLALIDFVFCTLTIPFNIGRLIRYYTFTELWVCKLFTSIIVFFILSSSHLLVTLAIHRFRQVCLPLKQQITPINIRYWIWGGFLLAVLLDIPQAILQPIDNEQFPNNITGHVCAVSFHSSIYAEIYNGFLTCLFVSYDVCLFVLYVMIGKKLYLQRKVNDSTIHFASHRTEISSKVTKIAVTVSAVFALSYVPLFVLKVISSTINQKELTFTEFAVLKIFERSYVFNHVANPFIYAFYDNHFRDKSKILFMSCCNFLRRTTDDETVTKRSGSSNSVDLKERHIGSLTKTSEDTSMT